MIAIPPTSLKQTPPSLRDTEDKPAMMINCAVYADGKRQADIAIDELPHVLANSEGFAWAGRMTGYSDK